MLKNIIIAVTSALTGAVVIFTLMVFLYQSGWVSVYPEANKQLEVLSLLLAAATLIITVVALFVALAGALSYTVIKDAAIAAAVVEAIKEARLAVAPLAERERQAISMGQPAGDRTQELAQALAGRSAMVDSLVNDPARLVIERYTQDTPVRVEAIARDLGIPVHLDPNMPEDVAGKIVKEGFGAPSGYAIYIRSLDQPRRQRFTLAHEIAHYVLHRDLIGDGLIDDALYRSKLGDPYERQANRMAADILMPAALVRGIYRGGTRALAVLSGMLNVSDAAMRIRLEELGLAP